MCVIPKASNPNKTAVCDSELTKMENEYIKHVFLIHLRFLNYCTLIVLNGVFVSFRTSEVLP